VRNEKINYKVREHSVGKVPVILAIGMQEVEGRTVSVRRLGETRTETISLDQAVGPAARQLTRLLAAKHAPRLPTGAAFRLAA